MNRLICLYLVLIVRFNSFHLSAQNSFEGVSDSLKLKFQTIIYHLNGSWDGGSLKYYIESNSLGKDVHRSIRTILPKLKGFEEKQLIMSATADILSREGNYKEAQELYFEIIKLAEQHKMQTPRYYANISLGIMYNELKMFNEAIKFYRKAEKFKKYAKYQEHLIPLYTNWADCYYEMATYDHTYYDSAMISCQKALTVLDQNTDISFEQVIYQTLGLIQTDVQKYKDAEKSLKRSLYLTYRMNDSSLISYGYYQLGRMYANSNNIYPPDSALNCLRKAYQINLKIKDVGLMVELYYSMAMAYKQKSDYEKSTEYILRYADLNDSFALQNNNAIIAELNKKFETAKKEAQIKDLNLERKESQAQLDRQNYFILVVVFILVFVLIIVFVLVKSNKAKRIANAIISEQKNVVEQKNHIIEEKQKEIVDSINYAKRIQYTLLAHDSFLKENLPHHFVYFKPKDIVSGDFYWATTRNNKFYLAVCDSTGHGVPGAFMSLLNIGFLTEAINEKAILEPHKVFEHVRQRLIENISKEGQKDGFDGILICLDEQEKTISYAAANNAPILVGNGEYNELPADRMPVGIGERKEAFQLFQLKYTKGDVLYLYTDGYADQFGGPKGKKFKYKQLNELLRSISGRSSAEQKQDLDLSYEAWRGDLEQIDDVCVIGIKF